ncbi:MAG: hypothetical protein ABJD97_02765 [Betaproteobacteria bacterium]
MPRNPDMDEEQVFAGYGIVIVKRIDRLFALYDAGGLAPRWVEAELSADEVKEARVSAQKAYAVLQKAQARGSERPLRPLRY